METVVCRCPASKVATPDMELAASTCDAAAPPLRGGASASSSHTTLAAVCEAPSPVSSSSILPVWGR